MGGGGKVRNIGWGHMDSVNSLPENFLTLIHAIWLNLGPFTLHDVVLVFLCKFLLFEAIILCFPYQWTSQ